MSFLLRVRLEKGLDLCEAISLEISVVADICVYQNFCFLLRERLEKGLDLCRAICYKK